MALKGPNPRMVWHALCLSTSLTCLFLEAQTIKCIRSTYFIWNLWCFNLFLSESFPWPRQPALKSPASEFKSGGQIIGNVSGYQEVSGITLSSWVTVWAGSCQQPSLVAIRMSLLWHWSVLTLGVSFPLLLAVPIMLPSRVKPDPWPIWGGCSQV